MGVWMIVGVSACAGAGLQQTFAAMRFVRR